MKLVWNWLLTQVLLTTGSAAIGEAGQGTSGSTVSLELLGQNWFEISWELILTGMGGLAAGPVGPTPGVMKLGAGTGVTGTTEFLRAGTG